MPVLALVIVLWVIWHGQKPTVPRHGVAVPVPAFKPALALNRDTEWQNARLQVEAFCWRVREDENVNLRVEDFDAQGGREEMIRFAGTLAEVTERGDMEAFVKFMADKNRAAKGPVKK
ncbi:MAG: hypothetical protein K9N47_11675 [Prosthecobacter sp.]|uniref:hypothetical protein n=1 Tax=Prosthecobacter sp. TaxID=1965333 RepID=UPI0025CFFF1A|nr:hypothetical protein [Prosthecobacter sp.]MCF7786774.1 hypothetical protein [Prosthecobacter sp.]